MIDPAFHRVAIPAKFDNGELRPPAVVPERLERYFPPVFLRGSPVEHASGHGIVSVGEQVGFHPDGLPYGPFNGEPASVYLWFDTFNDDTTPPVL
jgi:hypothetical protein